MLKWKKMISERGGGDSVLKMVNEGLQLIRFGGQKV